MRSAAVKTATIDAWAAYQCSLAERVVPVDDFPRAPLATVAGVDAQDAAAAHDGGTAPTILHASLVTLEWPSLKWLRTLHASGTPSLPYIPGYLGMREAPIIHDLLRKHAATAGGSPDVLLVDGNGLLHPRKAGLACQIGVECGIPTIGVSKTLYSVAGLDSHGCRGAMRSLLKQRGDCARLVGSDGFVYGAVLRTTGEHSSSPPPQQHQHDLVPPSFVGDVRGSDDASSEREGAAASSNGIDGGHGGGGGSPLGFAPIYVSVGHRVSLETAVSTVFAACRYRLPEPTRQADIACRAAAAVTGGAAPVVAEGVVCWFDGH